MCLVSSVFQVCFKWALEKRKSCVINSKCFSLYLSLKMQHEFHFLKRLHTKASNFFLETPSTKLIREPSGNNTACGSLISVANNDPIMCFKEMLMFLQNNNLHFVHTLLRCMCHFVQAESTKPQYTFPSTFLMEIPCQSWRVVWELNNPQRAINHPHFLFIKKGNCLR